MGFLLSPRHCGLSSLHHSDSSMAFNLSDSSLDWPEYDEATEPTETVKLPSSPVARVAQEETEDAPETDSHHHSNPQPVLEFSQSWPGARRSSEIVEPNDLTTKSKKQKQNHRRSSMSHNNSSNTTKPKTTKVRFSPTLEVRTHNIVLGDHPWCEDGLALELGWDYVDSRDICQNKEPRLPRWRSPQIQTRKQQKRSSSPPRQLSYLERKKLLLEVGGCSKVEIELRRFQSQILLQIEQDRQARLVEDRRRRREQQQQRSAPGSSSRSPSPSGRSGHRRPSIPTSRAGSAPSLYAAMA